VPFQILDVAQQRDALKVIAKLIEKGSSAPRIVRAARIITRDCPDRDDLCELETIFRAVKEGHGGVPGLERGYRYIADPRSVDYYQGAERILAEAEGGAAAGDCDEHTILVASLCAAAGFKVGARAYAKPRERNFSHVYAVAAVPKSGPWPKGYGGHGMDTTVAEAFAGWQPESGRVLTYWLE
jgi:transglutaminase-like putative cysteine protease